MHVVQRGVRCHPAQEAMDVAKDPSKSLMTHVGRCDGRGRMGGGVVMYGSMREAVANSSARSVASRVKAADRMLSSRAMMGGVGQACAMICPARIGIGRLDGLATMIVVNRSGNEMGLIDGTAIAGASMMSSVSGSMGFKDAYVSVVDAERQCGGASGMIAGSGCGLAWGGSVVSCIAYTKAVKRVCGSLAVTVSR